MSLRVVVPGWQCDELTCTSEVPEARGLCPWHYQRRRLDGTLPPLQARPMAIDRLMSFVVVLDTGCWDWLGKVAKQNGYAHFWLNGATVGAHVASFTLHTGAVPIGQIDHVCHNDASPMCDLGTLCPHRRCVNPKHLRDVSAKINTLSSLVNPARINADKTRCAQGHEYTPENTYRAKKQRVCRACARNNMRRYRAEGLVVAA